MVTNNKRGWIRILEATIAVLIVMGVLLVVYTNESSSPDLEEAISFYQDKALSDISTDKTLRLNVLLVPLDENSQEDTNHPSYVSIYGILNDSVNETFPDNFVYSLRICGINASSCNLDKETFIDTLDKNVYVDEVIISSEVNEGVVLYYPRRVRLFAWEK